MKNYRGDFCHTDRWFWLTTLFCLVPATAELIAPNIATATKITRSNPVYLTTNYLSLTQQIPIIELESQLDLLSFKLLSLRSVKDADNYEPFIITDGNYSITLFKRPMPLSNAKILCSSLNLPILTLENLPFSLKLPYLVTLYSEITVTNGHLICSSPGIFLQDDACLKHLLINTAKKTFATEYSSLKAYLLQTFPERTIIVLANATHFSLNPSSYGITGCKGSYKPERSKFQKIHDMYYMQLYGLQEKTLAFFDLCLNHLSDTVHAAQISTYVVPLKDTPKDLISQIQKLLPHWLPNHKNERLVYPQFETFFRKIISQSQDTVIMDLIGFDTVRKLPPRSQKLLLGSLTQFALEIKVRLSNFLSSFNPNIKLEIPQTVMFIRDQNPLTYISFLGGLVPNTNEEILVESLILLQNCKAQLAQGLASVFHKTLPIAYISYSDFIQIIDTSQSQGTLTRVELKRQKRS